MRVGGRGGDPATPVHRLPSGRGGAHRPRILLHGRPICSRPRHRQPHRPSDRGLTVSYAPVHVTSEAGCPWQAASAGTGRPRTRSSRLDEQGVFVDEDESLRRYGLRPSAEDLEQVRDLLRIHTALERRRQGDGDTELMRLCCVQLFNAGDPDDVPAIWRAKTSRWDAHCSIDVHLLCGAGLEKTKAPPGGRRLRNGRGRTGPPARMRGGGRLHGLLGGGPVALVCRVLPGAALRRSHLSLNQGMAGGT